jgi:ArsR family transcriptional regulator
VAARLPLVDTCAPITRETLSDEDATELERVFHALADRIRVKMLNLLVRAADDEICVCDFQAALDLKQPTASYHLKLLVDAGLAERSRRGTYSYYRLVPGALDRVAGLCGGEA